MREWLKALLGRAASPSKRLLSRLNPLRALRYGLFRLGNWRRGRVKAFDYVLLVLPVTLPALPEQRPWLQRRILGEPPLSLADLDRIFRQIGADPRPKGVILHLRGLAMPLADLQTLRASIQRLRQQGKRVIAFAQMYDNATYYVASACNEIILQPGGMLTTLGLVAQPVFLRNALAAVGVELDSVAITPFKGAYDSLTRETISPEGQQQLDWLLDSRYQMLLTDIAAGRGLTPDAVRIMIDTAPHLDAAALAQGYVDALLHEEGLAAHLQAEHLLTWSEAQKILRREWQPAASQYVAVLPLSGLMLPGESASPPVDLPLPFLSEERLGDLTVVRQVRHLMRNKAAAAVVLWIDSGGGAAIAADAMTAALRELAQDRPLVAYMNNVAASGGYYVATPAQWIVAQPGTITGSIGVILGKPVTRGLFDRLQINRMQFTRGANAALFSDYAPFTEAQRAQMRASIEHNYRQFVQLVAASRRLPLEAVDAVGGGRVWTGQQALAHGLVDELGDLKAAVAKARALAGLPEHAPAVLVQGKVPPLVPQVARKADPAAALRHMADTLSQIRGAALWLLPVKLE
jgi:protease-4